MEETQIKKKKVKVKVKIVAACFAVAFAVLGTGGFVVTNYITSSNAQVAEAALTSSQTRTVQTKHQTTIYIFLPNVFMLKLVENHIQVKWLLQR